MKAEKSTPKQGNAPSVLQTLRGATNRADYAGYTHLMKCVDEFEGALAAEVKESKGSVVQVFEGHVTQQFLGAAESHLPGKAGIQGKGQQQTTRSPGRFEAPKQERPLADREEKELAAFSWSKNIKTRSRKMLAVFRQMHAVAETSDPVLIQGETGTGKELVWKAVHAASRRDRPFLAVNCAGLTASLLDSELFGHVKGAFTGAVCAKQGVFEAVGNGTLFLDEVGDMPQELQAKLLRVLQEREFIPVGGTRPKEFWGRVITATHRNLHKMVEDGTFREDLYMRLSTFEIHLPPLRERIEDIGLLADVFLADCAERYKAGRKALAVSAVEALQRYSWPGNIRELQKIVKRLYVHCGKAKTLEEQHLRALPNSPFKELTKEAGSRLDDILRYAQEVPDGETGRVTKIARMAGMSKSNAYKILKGMEDKPRHI